MTAHVGRTPLENAQRVKQTDPYHQTGNVRASLRPPLDPAVARVRVNPCVGLSARRTRRRSKMKFGAYRGEHGAE